MISFLLCKKQKPEQANFLWYCMWEWADSVITSSEISTKDKLKYEPIMSKFDEHFKVHCNIILKHATYI